MKTTSKFDYGKSVIAEKHSLKIHQNFPVELLLENEVDYDDIFYLENEGYDSGITILNVKQAKFLIEVLKQKVNEVESLKQLKGVQS